MAGEEIVQKENKILRKVCKPVPIEDIKSRKVETIIRRMVKALESQEDGVAIAAPQIGENLCIFVISHRLFEIMNQEKIEREAKKHSKRENLETFKNEKPKEFKNLIFINPEILKISKKKIPMEEGCLSVRWLYGHVERAEKTLLKAFDENGKLFTMGGAGLLSQAFQHETDHLNGVLFTDKAKDVKEMRPEEINYEL